MKIALLQYAANQDKKATVQKAVKMVERAIITKAKWLLLPEVFNYRGDLSVKQNLMNAAETIPGPSTAIFENVARQHKIYILLGSMIEAAGDKRAYNTSVLIDPQGQIKAKYRKIHLFDARLGDKIVKESAVFLKGKKAATANIDEFKTGLSICYDLRFPDLYGKYARRSVNAITVPSCFTRKTGEAHWEVLLRARAIENLSYVLAPNQIGKDAKGIEAHGHSMIIDPWGRIIARGSKDKEEIVYGEINVEEVNKARAILPDIIKK